MAHQFETGVFFGKKAWHGLGTVLSADAATTMDLDAVMAAAGLDWTVEKQSLFYHSAAGVSHPVPENFANVRSDGALLGVVGRKYRIIQNREGFAPLESAIERGDLIAETAGSLKGGRVVWMLCRVRGATGDVSNGDQMSGYILAAMSHDGSLSICYTKTAIRVVCSNTMRMAIGANGAGAAVRIRHTASAQDGIDAIARAVDDTRQDFGTFLDKCRTFHGHTMTGAAARAFIEAVVDSTIPKTRQTAAQKVKESSPIVTADAADFASLIGRPSRITGTDNQTRDILGNPSTTRRDNIVNDILRNFDSGQGAEHHRGTAWGAVNAVTEYVTHARGRDDSRAFESMFGAGARMSGTAWDMASELVS